MTGRSACGSSGHVALAACYLRCTRCSPASASCSSSTACGLATEQGATWSSLFYVNNWWQLHGSTDYWSQFGAPSAFEHLWEPVGRGAVLHRVAAAHRCGRAVDSSSARDDLADVHRHRRCRRGVRVGDLPRRMGRHDRPVLQLPGPLGGVALGHALAIWLAARPDTTTSARARRVLDLTACAFLAGLCGLALTLDGTADQFVADGGMFLSGLARW